jgi:tetratricopeptide (TPR) repeat protein
MEDVFMAYERIHFTGVYRRLSSPFTDIIDCCLCKDPAHRYQSYDDFLSEIGSVAAKQRFSLPPKPHAYDESIEELFMHAQSLSALGQPEKALNAINRYLQYVPEAYWGWTEKGILLFKAGDVHGAIDSNRESLNLYGGNTHAWNNLGLAYNRLGQNEDSIKAFRNALMNDPQNVGAMMNMAASLISSGRFAEASSILQKAICLSPKKDVLLFNASNHAALMLKYGKTTEAQPLLELLTQEDPKNPTNWHNLALTHQSQGNRNVAIQCFKVVEQLNPNDSFCVLSLTRLLAETGAYEEAIVYCDKLLQKNAEVLKALSMKAQLLAATGRAKEGIKIVSAVLQEHPESDSLWFIVAELQMGIGDRNGAIESLNQCKRALMQNSAGSSPENVRLIEQRLQQLQANPHPL